MARSAADFLPDSRSLTSLRSAASGCRGCDLWKDATQTVFGEGRSQAEPMLSAFAGLMGGDARGSRGVWLVV